MVRNSKKKRRQTAGVTMTLFKVAKWRFHVWCECRGTADNASKKAKASRRQQPHHPAERERHRQTQTQIHTEQATRQSTSGPRSTHSGTQGKSEAWHAMRDVHSAGVCTDACKTLESLSNTSKKRERDRAKKRERDVREL